MMLPFNKTRDRKAVLSNHQLRLYSIIVAQSCDKETADSFFADVQEHLERTIQEKKSRIILPKPKHIVIGREALTKIVLPLVCIFFSFAQPAFSSLLVNNFYSVNNERFSLSDELGIGDFVEFGEPIILSTIAVKGNDFQDIVKCVVWDRNFNFLTVDQFLPEPETAILLFNFNVLINDGKFGFSVFSTSGYLNQSDVTGFTVSPSNYLPTLHRAPRYSVGANTLNVPEVLSSGYIWTAFLGMALIYGGRKLRNRK